MQKLYNGMVVFTVNLKYFWGIMNHLPPTLTLPRKEGGNQIESVAAIVPSLLAGEG
jgi:hypothetical protein